MLRDLLLNSTARHVFQLLPIALLFGGLFSLYRWKKGLANNAGREILLFLFACYVTGLLGLVLAPNNLWQNLWYLILNGHPGGEIGPLFSGGFSLEPKIFHYLTGAYTAGSWTTFMYIGNIAMFIPMGVFLPLVFQRRRPVWYLLSALGAILAIELLQPIMGRSFDMDDLICNTLGVLIGFGVWAVLPKKK